MNSGTCWNREGANNKIKKGWRFTKYATINILRMTEDTRVQFPSALSVH